MTDFQGALPECFSGFRLLVELDLRRNRLAGAVPVTLGSMFSMERLYLVTQSQRCFNSAAQQHFSVCFLREHVFLFFRKQISIATTLCCATFEKKVQSANSNLTPPPSRR